MNRLWDEFSVSVDWGYAARGASTALTILVIGGLSAPIAARIPLIGPYWLVVTAVLAFAVAGSRVGDAPSPAVHGAVTALFGYLLVLPIVVLGAGELPPSQLALTALLALVVGAVAGALAGRLRDAG